MKQIALTMIVKDDSEAELFERCLKSFRPHVDGLYVAVTGISGEHSKIHEIVKKYDGKSISTNPKTHPEIYADVNNDGKLEFANFAEARNASWSIVDEEYDYLTWADVDDVLTSGEELRMCAKMAKEKGYDTIFFTYWYAVKFDETGKPVDVIITQLRERLIAPKKYKWVSRLHEVVLPIDPNYVPRQSQWDLKDGRKCVWVHLTNQDRVDTALQRNRDILELQVKEEQGKDPRTLFALAKVCWDLGDTDNLLKSKEILYKYMEMSGWDAERANALEYLGMIFEKLKDYPKAAEIYHRATFEYPKHVIPYLKLSNVYFEMGLDEKAKEWLDIATKKKFENEAEPTIGNPYEAKLLAASLKLKEAQRDGDTKQMVYWAKVRSEIVGNDEDGILLQMEEHDYINDAARGIFNYAKWLKDHELEDYIPKLVDAIPPILGSLPFVHTIRNSVSKGQVWSDKSIVYYASFGVQHFEKWDWQNLKTGIGGSETAVIELSERWAKKGYEVTVYADVPEESTSPSGVHWKPYYTINWKDEFNILILWRSPHLVREELKAKKLYMDLHDVASQLDWTEERMNKVDKVFFKSEYHRNNLPKLPDEKCIVISNGI